VIDPFSLALGFLLSSLVPLVLMLALGRWAWNRLSRFNQIHMQRESGSVVVHIDYPDRKRDTIPVPRPKDLFDEAHS
jgi:hypothetical protein